MKEKGVKVEELITPLMEKCLHFMIRMKMNMVGSKINDWIKINPVIYLYLILGFACKLQPFS